VPLSRIQGRRKTGSSFPDCPALGPDGLEKLADDDGIVCLPSVRGESPAAERLRQLCKRPMARIGKRKRNWNRSGPVVQTRADLEEWLWNDFFEQHCDISINAPLPGISGTGASVMVSTRW
jgi:hypothetical protein